MSAEEILDCLESDVNEVVITGGEPFLQQNRPAWAELLRKLRAKNYFVCVETNGTIAPTEVTQTFVNHYSISPKLVNSGAHKKGQDRSLARWPDELKVKKACLKFVVRNEQDVAEAMQEADLYAWPRWNTWVMPEGTDSDALLGNFRAITEAAIQARANVSQRVHVLAFGNERGT